ncbi:hypothetical protein [Roseovarius aestuariivivens]|uniref:hypothetical protein n=1 Tax=Roseovarius aestuariivivens TaxID=1888910 RepID=UPI0010807833|nr:hypothetical protein [Roseovarius aestuariivivens]
MKPTFTSAIALAAMLSVPAVGMAASDTKTEADAEASVSTQAGDVAEEVGDTVYAIGESTTDAAQAGVDAVGGVAEDAYDAASDISAELDAALTGDAEVYSKDGELLGTYTGTDSSGSLAIIDLDGEMEGADDKAVERAGVRMDNLMVGENGVTVDMTKAQFANALKTGKKSKG